MGLFDFFKKKTKQPQQSTVNVNINVSFSGIESHTTLYTKEEQIALFLHFLRNTHRLPEEHEQYGYNIRFNCGNITNPRALHLQLIKEGYFENVSFERSIQRYRVQDLRELAESQNIDTKGKRKAELIALLCDTLPESTKDEIRLKSNEYVLSSKGIDYLKPYEALCYLGDHRNMGIDYPMYKEARQQFKGSYRDVLWQMLQSQLNEYYSSNNFHAACNKFGDIAQFLKEENHLKDSLKYWIICLYFKVNQCSAQSSILSQKKFKSINTEHLKRMIDDEPMPQYIINAIVALRSEYDTSILDSIFVKKYLPYHCLSNDDFTGLVNELIYGFQFDSIPYISTSINGINSIIDSLN